MSTDQGSKPRWRRRNATGGSRPHKVEVKLTEEEYVRLTAEAKVRNCSRPAVLMRALLADGNENARILRELDADLLAARRGMARVSANLNQAVKLEHSRRLEHGVDGTQFEKDMQTVLADLEAAIAKVVDVAEQVRVE